MHDLAELVQALGADGRLVHLERIPARPARTAIPATPVAEAVAARLPEGGLWAHQAAAVDLARGGQSVAVATGTASGKSLCYQLPIAEAVAEGRSTALLIYPTKALAQDQLRAMAAWDTPGLAPAVYDGDTPDEQRRWVRRYANVVLTNPDMLHIGILPAHARWATFLMRLRYVVLDELHTLRGVFGTHVAHVLRRLRRLCAHYGSSPTFVFGSATIGKPGELASALSGLDVAEVTDDGSPRGERLFAVWQPPLLDEETGARESSNKETARVLASLVENDFRAIAFTRSRKGAELVAASARSSLPDKLASAVRPYRGGYLAAERREIEKQLFGGELRGVAATNALELGIDVGGLDACILNGFPGTIASMWQQAGRAGRAQQRSLAVLVTGEDALDQWFATHPDELFSRSPEPAVVNPSNPFVLDPHLACAAFELPLTPADEAYWGDDLDESVSRLVHDDVLKLRNGRAVYARPERPAALVGLRTGTNEEYRIVAADGNLIGTVDRARAFTSVHPGAVYLHQGQHYRVDSLDLVDRTAWVVAIDPSEITQARTDTDIRILAEDDATTVGRARLAVGDVEVTEWVTGYRRKDLRTGEVLGDENLDLPPSTLRTRAFWYTVEDSVLAAAGVLPALVPGTLHAAEHAGIGMLPLFTICDRWDVGGVSTAFQVDTGLPTIVIYDGYPGGAGIAELGFGAAERHLAATLEAIERCPCAAGCPSCVQSPKCGNLNEPLEKAGAVSFLRTVLSAPPARRRRVLRRP